MEKYVAFLRGINVGGHHKVPMADLRSELEKMDFKNIGTILNSGNILFETNRCPSENIISNRLETVFGFPIPILIRKFEEIVKMFNDHPFENMEVTKDLRLYVSFLRNEVDAKLSLPWKSEDGSYTIIAQKEKAIYSTLDLVLSRTPKAMDAVEKYYGKDITTRNWNTIKRIMTKASVQQWL